METEKVAIIDAGGQYVDLVKKAVERLGVPAEILKLQTPLTKIQGEFSAIIISGSPVSSSQETAPKPDSAIWASKLPILGICYGMQAMAKANGGSVATNSIREDGRIITNVDNTHPIFKGTKKSFNALFTHGDFVIKVPKGFKAIGKHKLHDGQTAYSAIAKGNTVGVQFHPEVFDDTPEGYQLFKNFLFGVAKLKQDKNFKQERISKIIKKKRSEIAEIVGDNHVIAFVSGGVDSSVTAALASEVIDAKKFHAYYIDSGFMRDEDDMVIKDIKNIGIPVKKIDARETFKKSTILVNGKKFGPLKDVTNPEIKRKIIGKTFVDVQNNIIKQLKLKKALLLQGTTAADRIESGHSTGGKHTKTIKTHHNQVEEIQELKKLGLVLEPLDDLFKDEVRDLGKSLGSPSILVLRHPFPGPGNAIRIICLDKDESKPTDSPVNSNLLQFVSSRPYLKKIPVSTTVLPIKSVGVGGDERSHKWVAAVQGKNLDHKNLSQLALDIPGNFRDSINRIIYRLDSEKIDSFSITKTHLDDESTQQLRQVDKIVFEEMRAYKILNKIDQMPIVLLPISFGRIGERSIVLRPVTTSTFMTVQAMLPVRDLPTTFFEKVSSRIIDEVPGISSVFLDITNKPPATTEWE